MHLAWHPRPHTQSDPIYLPNLCLASTCHSARLQPMSWATSLTASWPQSRLSIRLRSTPLLTQNPHRTVPRLLSSPLAR